LLLLPQAQPTTIAGYYVTEISRARFIFVHFYVRGYFSNSLKICVLSNCWFLTRKIFHFTQFLFDEAFANCAIRDHPLAHSYIHIIQRQR
jgi:hypothetical protein